MGLFNALEASASALSAERQRAEVVAANLANAESTRTDNGIGPFRRKLVVFSSPAPSRFQLLLTGLNKLTGGRLGGVRLTKVIEDPAPPIVRYEPGHPDADPNGYVAYPAINPVQEMVDLMGAVRAYQLNASAVNASKQMIQQSLDILK